MRSPLRTPERNAGASSELTPNGNSVPLISFSRSPSPYARKHSNSNAGSESTNCTSCSASAAAPTSNNHNHNHNNNSNSNNNENGPLELDDAEDEDDEDGEGHERYGLFAGPNGRAGGTGNAERDGGRDGGRYGVRRLFKTNVITSSGSLGRWLLATHTGSQVYIVLLGGIYCASAAGLTFLNRLVLLTGVYKFLYPLTYTFMQLLLTHLVLYAVASITRWFARPLTRWGFATVIAPARPLRSSHASRGADKSGPSLSRYLKRIVDGQGGIAGGGLLEFDTRTALQILPVAVVFFAKIVLSNRSFAFTQYSMYTLYRIAIVPLSLMLTARLSRTSHSVATLSSSLIATLNLLIATSRSGVRVTWESIVCGVFSSFFVALYPILLIRTHRKLVSSLIPQGDLLMAYSPPLHAVDTPSHHHHHHLPPHHHHHHQGTAHTTPPPTSTTATREDTRATWQLLHYISLLTLLLLFPLVLLSGEVGDISRNCYFLDVPFFWFLVVSSSLLSTVVLISSFLFAHATSPLMASFTFVPRSAFMLFILSAPRFGLPVHTWVGIGLCALSCAWFVGVRIKEGALGEGRRGRTGI